jgi:zinc finger CCHC domain-containing protein 9
MVRVTDFARPKRTYDRDEELRKPLPPQTSAYQSQRTSTNPRSEVRRLKRKSIRESDKECFVCRQTGHLSQDCPKNEANGDSTVNGGGRICYRCGRIDHSLKDCKKRPQKQPQKRKREGSISGSEDETPEQEFLPYAKCYVCQKTGHLAGSCPENDRGIYPDGGGCKLCGMRLA